jgi:hypothetical protein
METYKLQIKVGQHEFQAEGRIEDVRRDFELWKAMIADIPSHPQPSGNGSESPQPPKAEIPQPDVLQRLYLRDDKRKLVTLRILPRSDDRNGESLLLLLLGFGAMMETNEVPVTMLRAALRQSGCTIDRVDQVAVKYVRQGLLNKGGRGKGGKYSLTNAGAEKAKSLLTAMLSS